MRYWFFFWNFLYLRIGIFSICFLAYVSKDFFKFTGFKAYSATNSLTACSFYDNRLLNSNFWNCAEPNVIKRSCTLVKGVCPACIKYKGDRGHMYMPDFFVEVTTEFGKSHFDSYPTLMTQLRHAASYYGGHSFLNDGGSSGELSHETFWHARILQPPFGTTSWGYLDMPFTGVATSLAPVCFQGISEYLKDQWNFNIADLSFATAWAPVGLKVCNSTVAAGAAEVSNALRSAKNNALSSILGISDSKPVSGIGPLGCALPMSGKAMLAMNLKPTSDAFSFKKLCMSEFGNLIPRTGTQETEDPFISAVKAAWKFLSLVRDVHPHSGVSNEFNHKWQLVYPTLDPNSARCFKPGTWSAGHWPTRGPFEIQGLSSNTYIFAIWRPRLTNTCYEPETAELLWKKRVKNIDYQAFKAACEVL